MKLIAGIVALAALLVTIKAPVSVSQAEARQPQVAILSYQQLINYPIDCKIKTEQLSDLLKIQQIKNFNPNSDELNESDYHYNSRLKATIWYYAYGCEK